MNWRRLARGLGSLADARVATGPRSGAAMATDESPPCQSTYFRRTHPLFMAMIGIGLIYYGWAVFLPETMPFDYLGPLGTFTCYLVENYKLYMDIGYVITWLIHIVEALYTFKLCRDKGITDLETQFWWAAQTLLFGFASFAYLLFYKPPKKKRQ